MANRRAEWAERVGQWRRSGLTAREFAKSIGVKPATLAHWAWRVGRERGSRPRSETPALGASARFVEVIGGEPPDGRFELELGNGRRLHIPAGFEATTLERLLRIVEAVR